MNFRLPLAALAGLFLLTACPSPKPTETEAPGTTTEAPLPKAPVFNVDSAYAFTARQIAFGPRVPNRPEIGRAHV